MKTYKGNVILRTQEDVNNFADDITPWYVVV